MAEADALQEAQEDEVEIERSEWELLKKQIQALDCTDDADSSQIIAKHPLIQDLKTVNSEDGNYVSREVGPGSTVLIRGADKDDEIVTWVGIVNKIYKERKKRSNPDDSWKVEVCWFYRQNDLPEEVLKLAQKQKLRFIENEYILSNYSDPNPAHIIRHPCTVWFQTPTSSSSNVYPELKMRVGTGTHRTYRGRRPGFIVRKFYDVNGTGLVYNLNDPKIRDTVIAGKTIQQLCEESRQRLKQVEEAEKLYDATHGIDPNSIGEHWKSVTDMAVDMCARSLLDTLTTETTTAISTATTMQVSAQMKNAAHGLFEQLGDIRQDPPSSGVLQKLDIDTRKRLLIEAKVPNVSLMELLLNALLEAPQDTYFHYLSTQCGLIRPLVVWLLRLMPKVLELDAVKISNSSETMHGLRVLIAKLLKRIPLTIKSDRWIKSLQTITVLKIWYNNYLSVEGDDKMAMDDAEQGEEEEAEGVHVVVESEDNPLTLEQQTTEKRVLKELLEYWKAEYGRLKEAYQQQKAVLTATAVVVSPQDITKINEASARRFGSGMRLAATPPSAQGLSLSRRTSYPPPPLPPPSTNYDDVQMITKQAVGDKTTTTTTSTADKSKVNLAASWTRAFAGTSADGKSSSMMRTMSRQVSGHHAAPIKSPLGKFGSGRMDSLEQQPAAKRQKSDDGDGDGLLTATRIQNTTTTTTRVADAKKLNGPKSDPPKKPSSAKPNKKQQKHPKLKALIKK